MRISWKTRVSDLEKMASYTFGAEIFEDWLEKNRHLETDDYWALIDLAPQELRLECTFYVLKKLKASR
ncbi:MAG: hypothetical protein V4489_02920 [Chlamydiota bacterium]